MTVANIQTPIAIDWIANQAIRLPNKLAVIGTPDSQWS